MRRLQIAICAALIALTPLPAAARIHYGGHHRGGHRHAGGHRVSWGSPQRFSYAPRLREPPGATCGLGLRDSRGRLRRCAAAKAAFERDNPCPSTGQSRGPCPGYIVDHIIPLKRGGPDDPSNMQWQTVDDAKAKDKIE